jgi:hypothetical protein
MSSSARDLSLAQRLYASGIASADEPSQMQAPKPFPGTNAFHRAGAPPALSGVDVQAPLMATNPNTPTLANVKAFNGSSSSFYHRSIVPQQRQTIDQSSLPRHNISNAPGSPSSFGIPSPPSYSVPQPQNITGQNPVGAYPSRDGSYMYNSPSPLSPGLPSARSLGSNGSPAPPMPTSVTPHTACPVLPTGTTAMQPYYPTTPIAPPTAQYPQPQGYYDYAQAPHVPAPGLPPAIIPPAPNQFNMMPMQSPPQSPPGGVAATQAQQQSPAKKSHLVRNVLIGAAGVGAVGLAVVAGTEIFDNDNDQGNSSNSNGDTNGGFNFFGSGDGSSSTDGGAMPASGPDPNMMMTYDGGMFDPNAAAGGMMVPSDGYYYASPQQSSHQSSHGSESTLKEAGEVASAAYEVGGFVSEHTQARPPPQHAYTYPGYPVPPGQYPAGTQPNPGAQDAGAQNATAHQASGKFGMKPDTMATIHKVGTYAKGAAAVAKLGIGIAKLVG